MCCSIFNKTSAIHSMANQNPSVPMVTDSVQGSRNCIWGAEMKGNISNVRFTSLISSHPPFSHNWPKFVPQPSKEPFVLYLPDSPLSRNLTANHHVVKDPTTNDMDFESLCSFPDVKVSQNSEISNFTKCGGDGDPLAHVKIVYNELGAHGKDERLRMCLFQRSLCGDALQWFIHLNRSELQSCNGFIRAFLDKFELGSESILDRIDFMDMKRRQHESFGKYARHWRNVTLLGLVNHRFSEVVEQGYATDNFYALHHKIQGLIDNGEFIPLTDVKQAYDPSINMISDEKSSDDGTKLTIPESEIIEKFSQMHLRLKGKTTINEEFKPMPEIVTREEFLRPEGQFENM
ncbi:hypothetical protein ACH5RR_001547 [Cinchona calisaya]|uniref:Retrotransposon gag domain-containing protein n=1 Tax=Cinchona calisaya TaxID=153742 RepID=A0ABD3B451_9GENT